jgi:hypothetical protein
MSGYNKLFLDENAFYSLEDSYTSVNGIWLYPMEYMATHNGTTLGLQELSIQGVVMEEVTFANLDVVGSVGKYTIDPITNSVILIVAKATIDTDAKAIAEITGFLLTYQMKTLEYFSTDSLYTMESYAADGTFLGSTLASSTSVLISKMMVMDASQDVNSDIGYQSHTFRRALQVA